MKFKRLQLGEPWVSANISAPTGAKEDLLTDLDSP